MQIQFTKMHGLGNDFVVINAIDQSISLNKTQIKFMGDRHFGIGFDQLLLIESSDVEGADFRYRIYNADGGEVEQCGNGARCFARFVIDEGLSTKTEIPVITKTGKIILIIKDDENVTVNMGSPELSPDKLPFTADQQAINYSLNIGQEVVEFCAISMGNPHAVILVDDIDTAAVEKIGKALQSDPHFPQSVNVGFMQVIDKNQARIRVYERGVGETQACGTGACAAIVAGRLLNILDETVTAKLNGGDLSINWQGDASNTNQPVMMTGPTETVFKGTITL
ncbi:MAG TPA: diaminopimelate epimerase [Leucothrix sp.]|nr:diaminopimelate epimerase [Leucothrix sp.]